MKVSKHPSYSASLENWKLWRLTYVGGSDFVDEYLEKFSAVETAADFLIRKNISYCPAFAKSALNDVKNAIFQRTTDITRENTSVSYKNAVSGNLGGVDYTGSTMNAFIGRKVLPELLSISKVGVYVDMPVIDTPSMLMVDAHPYIYLYKAEDILNWTYKDLKLSNLVLRDTVDVVDEDGFTTSTEVRYRVFSKTDSGVTVEFFDKNEAYVESVTLEISEIPFVIFEMSDSLLTDISGYQIALVNLASSDINYALKCNFPFYTEQFDPRLVSSLVAPDTDSGKTEIEVGTTTGRRYPKGLDRPGFINPSSDPLRASMEKQTQLKAEIKQLISLALTNLEPKKASADSKSMDQQGLEAGLSYIGLELETGERNIAVLWSMYEGQPVDPTIKYPTKYSLESDSEKRKQASDLQDLTNIVPSITYKKAISREIANITIGTKVSNEELETIYNEIRDAEVININPDEIAKDVEVGLVDLETASIARGYPAGSVEKAKKEHAERLARIAESQAKDRGVTDLGGTAKTNPKDTTADDVVKDKERGEGNG